METEFTPYASLAGGMLIGLSAVGLMAANGRIAGISGLTARLLSRGKNAGGPLSTSLFFVLGLLLAAPAYLLVTGSWPAQTVSQNLPLLGVAGLLVGFGAVFGNGCTSGHGVCGISRGSKRSMVATITFMVTAAISVYLLRHVFGG